MKIKLTLFVSVIAVTLFGMGCASTETNSDPLKNGLVAYYPFNGNANDESGNGNHGGVSGATFSADRHGKSDKAYSFDGSDDYINVPHHASQNISAGLTLSAWMKSDVSGKEVCILAKGNTRSNNNDFILRIGEPGQLNYAWRPSGQGDHYLNSSNKIPIGQWMHVVATHISGSQPLLFVDGIQQPLSDTWGRQTNPRSFYNQAITIGMDKRGSGANFFEGQLDDVRIYNRALSAKEVKTLYDLEKPKTK